MRYSADNSRGGRHLIRPSVAFIVLTEDSQGLIKDLPPYLIRPPESTIHLPNRSQHSINYERKISSTLLGILILK